MLVSYFVVCDTFDSLSSQLSVEFLNNAIMYLFDSVSMLYERVVTRNDKYSGVKLQSSAKLEALS